MSWLGTDTSLLMTMATHVMAWNRHKFINDNGNPCHGLLMIMATHVMAWNRHKFINDNGNPCHGLEQTQVY